MNSMMNAWTMAFAYLRDKKLATALNILLLSLGVGTIITLVLILSQAEDRLEHDTAGVDLVIGAKGSPMQLILSSVFHVDIPTGNVPMEEAAPIISHPMVKRAVPLALGDSYRGYRIVGTDVNFLSLYEGKFANGRIFEKPLEAVIGADVARTTGLAVGKKFAGTHGLTESTGAAHEDHPYEVVGVLASTGSVADRLILTSVASVWKLHDHEDRHERARDGHEQGEPQPVRAPNNEMTAYLIQYATPLAAASFPRLVNASTSLQAASPAMESARLFQLVGIGVNALKGFAAIMILCAALGIFIGLMGALDECRVDLALLRVLGATPATVFLTMLLQGLTLGFMGVILGTLLGHAGAEWIGHAYAETQRVTIGGRLWVREESYVIAMTIGLSIVASLIPAWRAYREATPALLAVR